MPLDRIHVVRGSLGSSLEKAYFQLGSDVDLRKLKSAGY